ncbi:unnamed protein product [Heterobilharzia americana]|nr:unnamed protein product [Heterobilharzia americana]
MDLFIETLTGRSFELHVSPAETVMSVKSKIQRAEGIPITQQHLIWQNSELDDHRRLRDYSISEGSTLRLVLSLRGGPLNAHRVPRLRLAPIHSPPFTSKFLFSCSSSFLRSNISTSRVKPSLLRSRPTNTPESPNSVLGESGDISQVTDTKCSKLKKDKETSSLISGNALKLKPIELPVNLQQKCINSSDLRLEAKERKTDPTIGFSVDIDPLINPESNGRNSNISDNNPFSNSEIVAKSSTTGLNTTDTSHAFMQAQTVEDYNKDVTEDLTLVSGDAAVLTNGNPVGKSDILSIIDQPEFPEFPPLSLVHSSEKFSSTLNRWELPSTWRLCETCDVPLLANKSYSITGNSESVSGTKENNCVNTTKLLDEKERISNAAETTKTTSTSFLADLLARIVPNEAVPDCWGRLRYPYHWLRKTYPFPEENEEQNPEWHDDDSDAHTANIFETDTDRDEIDFDDYDCRASCRCGIDDEDSLADLEDYLFHYRTGDLLFSPPFVSTGYPPYSYYTFRDSHGVDQWDSDTNHEGLRNETRELDGLNPSESLSWRQECDQLTEKVMNLKTKMKTVRLRRQGRHQNNETESTICKQVSPTIGQHTDIPECENFSKSVDECVVASAMNCAAGSQINEGPLSNTHSSSLSSFNEASEPTRSSQMDCRNRIRQRRYGTVTPPDVSILIETVTSQSEGLVTAPPNIPSVWDSELILSFGNNLKNSSLHLSPRLSTGFSSSKTNYSTSVASYLSKEPKAHVNSTNSPVPGSVQGNKSPRSVTSSRLSPTNNCPNTSKETSTEPKRPSSPAPFLPNLRTSISTVIPSRLPSRRDQTQTTGHLGNVVICDQKQLKLAPTHYVSSNSTEGSHLSSPSSTQRKRCALCLRKIGLANSYTCRCGRSFCSRHRYAEVHACSYDYKAEARRYLVESNPVITAPKLPKI